MNINIYIRGVCAEEVRGEGSGVGSKSKSLKESKAEHKPPTQTCATTLAKHHAVHTNKLPESTLPRWSIKVMLARVKLKHTLVKYKYKFVRNNDDDVITVCRVSYSLI